MISLLSGSGVNFEVSTLSRVEGNGLSANPLSSGTERFSPIGQI